MMISKMIMEAYGTYLQPRRFPVFVLHLDLPFEMVDVNVHPQKKEVRLRQFNHIREALCRVISQGLSQAPRELESPPSVQPTFVRQSARMPNFPNPIKDPPFFLPEKKPQAEQTLPLDLPPMPKVLTTIKGYIILDPESIPKEEGVKDGCLLIVDQQRAFASVIFDQLVSHLEDAEELSIQRLLMPLNMKFARDEAYIIREHLQHFKSLGIHLEVDGEEGFLLDSYPQCFENVDFNELLRELAQENQQEDQFSKFLALRAARHARGLKKTMQIREAEIFVRRLFRSRNPYFSPAGKRTLCYLNSDKITELMEL